MGIKARTAKTAKTGTTSRQTVTKKKAKPKTAKKTTTTKARKRTTKTAGKTVDAYIASLGDWRAEAVSELRQMVRDVVPEADEAIKWGQPVYSFNGPFCYIRAFKNHVNLGFWRGKDLDDPDRLLTSGGQKMAHVKITSLDDIDPDLLEPFIDEAADLNEELGDPTR